MSSFITLCPNCKTSFNITPAQLKLAKGKVRCGFCLQTFSALEHQLFIEDDIQANEQLFNTIKPSNDSNERELEIPENLADTNEESAADQAIKNLPEESDENAIEENSHHTNRLFEEDNTKGEESETSLPAYEQTDSGNMEASDVVEEPGDGLYIDEVLKDEEIKVAEEIIEEQKEGEEEEKKQESVNIVENVNAEDEINETTDEELQTIKQADQEEIEDRNESAIAVAYSNKDEGLEENNDGDESDKAVLASPEDYQNIDKSSFEEDLSEETALKEDLEENLQAKEEIEISIKEKVLETDTSSIDISSSEAIKKKEELQSLEALFDDEALNTDGRNPVNSISEEPISIYRQYSRPAIVTALLFFSNALLIIALGAQYAWANFDIYLRESRFSNITGFVCNYANCPDVRRFDLSAFATDQLIVNSHPTISNALQIDFIFRNTAEFEQQFPIVELNFSDLNRRLLANRLFQPEEYLEQDLQQFNYLPPNSSIQIRLEIADPGPEAINYSLSLRTP